MITKMTKYSMILLSGDLERFLAGVQELGMVDITRSVTGTDGTSKEMTSLIERCRAAESILAAVAKEHPEITAAPASGLSAEQLLKAVEDNTARRNAIASEMETLEKEYRNALPWGEFTPEDVTRLRAAGLTPHFYCVGNKQYSPAWEQQYPMSVLARSAGNTYFVVIGGEETEYTFPVSDEAAFPARPASQVMKDISALKAEDGKLLEETAGYAPLSGLLQELSGQTFARLDLHLAETSSLLEGEGAISVVEGFAPTADDARVQEYLNNGPCTVYWQSEAAKGSDNPPVKLRNNWFARLFEPVGSLYELPNYDELDLTPYFAPFYMLFFGFCLGDMGYGLILVIAGIAAALALPRFKVYGKLIAWLGVGSLIMPLFSGTFFGMKLADILPMPDNIKALFFSDLKMFWFAIIFGLFQIVFARMLKAIFAFSKRRWDEALTEVGWSLLIVWAACAYAGSQMGTKLLPHIVSQILVFGGLILVLFCSKPAKFFLLRPLKGIVSLYDITSIFGDMLSYIRLFGLGTTGGILALVINSIAMTLSGIPYVGWPVTVIFLIFGHLAVMGLSCLGAFVHPVRLTFVEFYKNVGFEGGGRAYRPLKSYSNNK